MNRRDSREMAQIRMREARVLLQSRNHSGAYYLPGYVVECALKACIAKQTRKGDFPDRARVTMSHSHDLASLLNLAGLSKVLDEATKSNDALADNWRTVKDWSEASRYERQTQVNAQNMLNAVGGAPNGVLRWIKQYW